jgi:hypothetical protein
VGGNCGVDQMMKKKVGGWRKNQGMRRDQRRFKSSRRSQWDPVLREKLMSGWGGK